MSLNALCQPNAVAIEIVQFINIYLHFFYGRLFQFIKATAAAPASSSFPSMSKVHLCSASIQKNYNKKYKIQYYVFIENRKLGGEQKPESEEAESHFRRLLCFIFGN